jgi:hypothetical protein
MSPKLSTKPPAQSVFITGASSGLGKQMAKEFAARGYDLALAARRLGALEALRKELQGAHGIRVEVYPLDVSDVAAVQTTIPEAQRALGRLDIVIANAGLGDDHEIGRGDFSTTKRMIDVNITGAFATVDTAVRVFNQQGFGQIVGISSLASCRGLPRAGTYSASKAALVVYLEALRVETVKKNIQVTVLLPGFIDTPINQHVPNRPFLIDVERGGKLMTDLIIKRVDQAYIPKLPWALIIPLFERLPSSVIARAF